MNSPQSGIFALGTSSHAYLEFDANNGDDASRLVTAVASLREPRTTMGGVNLVAGFRPELWREVVPGDAPEGLDGFNEAIVGPDGYTMPATQHDAVLWLSGSAYDVVFEVGRGAISAVAGLASVAAETSSWPYRHDLDLTGFIDGTENPTLLEASEVVLLPEGSRGAGGAIRSVRPAHGSASAGCFGVGGLAVFASPSVGNSGIGAGGGLGPQAAASAASRRTERGPENQRRRITCSPSAESRG